MKPFLVADILVLLRAVDLHQAMLLILPIMTELVIFCNQIHFTAHFTAPGLVVPLTAPARWDKYIFYKTCRAFVLIKCCGSFNVFHYLIFFNNYSIPYSGPKMLVFIPMLEKKLLPAHSFFLSFFFLITQGLKESLWRFQF